MDEAAKPRTVAIGTIVRFAYRSVFGRLGLIPELGWIMLLVLLAVAIVPRLLLPGPVAGDMLRLDPLDYVQLAVALLAISAFAVRWHQLILLGDPRRQPSALFLRGWARFLIYGCILYAVLGVILSVMLMSMQPMAGSTATTGLIALAALISCWLVLLATARCALVFPAAACGKPLGIGTAWRLMRGNSWRLIGASIVTALPLKILAFVLTAMVLGIAMPDGPDAAVAPPVGLVILIGVIEAVSDMLLAALGASVLSGFYRELVAWRANGAAANA